jgi:hypothetical protein
MFGGVNCHAAGTAKFTVLADDGRILWGLAAYERHRRFFLAVRRPSTYSILLVNRIDAVVVSGTLVSDTFTGQTRQTV